MFTIKSSSAWEARNKERTREFKRHESVEDTCMQFFFIKILKLKGIHCQVVSRNVMLIFVAVPLVMIDYSEESS